jgi:hypothetical protein
VDRANPHLAPACTSFEFEAKDPPQQRGPSGAFATVVVIVMSELFSERPWLGIVAVEQAELTNDGVTRRSIEDDASAEVMMTGEDAEIANQGEARRRHEGDESSDEVERVEQDGSGTVLPRAFEADADAAIGAKLEAVVRERRSTGVTNESFKSLAVMGRHAGAGVNGQAMMASDKGVGRRLTGRSRNTETNGRSGSRRHSRTA